MEKYLDKKAKELESLIRRISEKNYYAGWFKDIEYILWEIMMNFEYEPEIDVIWLDDSKYLYTLAKEIHGWVYFKMSKDKKGEVKYVEINKWLKMYDKYKIRQNEKLEVKKVK